MVLNGPQWLNGPRDPRHHGSLPQDADRSRWLIDMQEEACPPRWSFSKNKKICFFDRRLPHHCASRQLASIYIVGTARDVQLPCCHDAGILMILPWPMHKRRIGKEDPNLAQGACPAGGKDHTGGHASISSSCMPSRSPGDGLCMHDVVSS